MSTLVALSVFLSGPFGYAFSTSLLTSVTSIICAIPKEILPRGEVLSFQTDLPRIYSVNNLELPFQKYLVKSYRHRIKNSSTLPYIYQIQHDTKLKPAEQRTALSRSGSTE